MSERPIVLEGENRLVTRYKKWVTLTAADEAKVRRAVEAAEDAPANPRAAAGDAMRLRGLPAVGVRGGYGGTILGTQPERETIRRLDGKRRRS